MIQKSKLINTQSYDKTIKQKQLTQYYFFITHFEKFILLQKLINAFDGCIYSFNIRLPSKMETAVKVFLSDQSFFLSSHS